MKLVEAKILWSKICEVLIANPLIEELKGGP